MATVTKLTPTGIHYSGEIDEATFNPNSGYTKNLATWSEQFTNSVWSSITRSNILANTDIAPDGTKTASTIYNTLGNAQGYIRRTYPVVNGQTYCYSIYAKAKEINYLWMVNFIDGGAFAGDQVIFDLINGNISYNPAPSRIFYPTITSVGNGWYRCSMCQTVGLSYTFTAGAGGIVAAGPGTQFGGGGAGDGKSGILIWGAQMEVLNSTPSIYTSMTTVPTTSVSKRVDYNGKNYITGTFDEATFNSNSPVIKNLFNYTETFDFDFINWTYNVGLIKQNATLAPDGVSLAPKFIEFRGLGNQRFYNWMPLTAETTYTYSIYLKAAERYIVRCYTEDVQSGGGGRVGAYLNLRTGTIITPYITGTNTLLGSKLESVGNDWFRFSWTVRAVLSANLNTTGFMIVGMAIDEVPNFNYVGDGNSGIYIWGAQKEISNSVGIYQGIGAPNTLIPTKFKQRVQAQGDTYITGNYDEVTGILPITDNLLMSYDVAFANSSSILYDASGFNNNVTMVNSPSLIENFFRLDGSTQYGNIIPASLNQPYSGKTIFAILRLDPSITLSGATYRGFIGSNTNSRNFNSYIYTDASGHRIHYSTGRLDGASTGSFSNLLSITAGRWFTVAITQDSTGSGNYYCNGASVGTIGPPLFQYLPNTFEFFGSADNRFFGDISHISVYKRGLSANEISTLHNTFKFRFGI